MWGDLRAVATPARALVEQRLRCNDEAYSWSDLGAVAACSQPTESVKTLDTEFLAEMGIVCDTIRSTDREWGDLKEVVVPDLVPPRRDDVEIPQEFPQLLPDIVPPRRGRGRPRKTPPQAPSAPAPVEAIVVASRAATPIDDISVVAVRAPLPNKQEQRALAVQACVSQTNNALHIVPNRLGGMMTQSPLLEQAVAASVLGACEETKQDDELKDFVLDVLEPGPRHLRSRAMQIESTGFTDKKHRRACNLLGASLALWQEWVHLQVDRLMIDIADEGFSYKLVQFVLVQKFANHILLDIYPDYEPGKHRKDQKLIFLG